MFVAVLAMVLCNAMNTEQRRSLNRQKCTVLSSTDRKLYVGLSVCLCVNQRGTDDNRHTLIHVILHAQTTDEP